MRGFDNRVNRCIAGRTRAEYQIDNKEQIAAQQREYRQTPEVKARRNAQAREYYEANRDQIAAQKREYRQQNRDQIAAQMREYSQRPEAKAWRNAKARENYRQRKKEQQLSRE